MRLYCDDLRQAPTGWTLARSVSQAIRLLATGRVTHLDLDHDIEFPGDWPKERQEDFTAVLEYALLLPAGLDRMRPTWYYCHSGNPIAYDKFNDMLAAKGERKLEPGGMYRVPDLDDELDDEEDGWNGIK